MLDSRTLFDPEHVFVGITPTGWTNDDFPLLGNDISFGQVVSEMALAGYQGCSVGHNFPKDEAVLKAELDRRGLRVSEPWASTFFTVRDMGERTVEAFKDTMGFIKRMGGTSVVVAELGGAVHQQPVPPHREQADLYERPMGGADRRSEHAGPSGGGRRDEPVLPSPHGHRRDDPRRNRPAHGRDGRRSGAPAA